MAKDEKWVKVKDGVILLGIGTAIIATYAILVRLFALKKK